MCVTIFSLHLKKQHFYRAFFSVLSSASKRNAVFVALLLVKKQHFYEQREKKGKLCNNAFQC